MHAHRPPATASVRPRHAPRRDTSDPRPHLPTTMTHEELLHQSMEEEHLIRSELIDQVRCMHGTGRDDRVTGPRSERRRSIGGRPIGQAGSPRIPMPRQRVTHRARERASAQWRAYVRTSWRGECVHGMAWHGELLLPSWPLTSALCAGSGRQQQALPPLGPPPSAPARPR